MAELGPPPAEQAPHPSPPPPPAAPPAPTSAPACAPAPSAGGGGFVMPTLKKTEKPVETDASAALQEALAAEKAANDRLRAVDMCASSSLGLPSILHYSRDAGVLRCMRQGGVVHG